MRVFVTIPFFFFFLASKEEDDDSDIEDQLHLLESEDKSDLILICEDRYFNVHSHIISARSDIFKLHIQQLQGKKSLMINDIGSHALKLMLHYMYSGKLPGISIESAMKVYDGAHKYLLRGLERKCISLVKSKLNERNVCDVLAFSDRLQDNSLKDVVITYLLNNKSFLISETWRRFSEHYVKLSNEVHYAYVKRYQ